MIVNTNNLVTLTEADENFSRVTRLVDENGAVVILKNNIPRYVLIEYSQFQDEDIADDTTVHEIAESIVKRHIEAFRELAK